MFLLYPEDVLFFFFVLYPFLPCWVEAPDLYNNGNVLVQLIPALKLAYSGLKYVWDHCSSELLLSLCVLC